VRVGERLILGADVTHFASTLDDLRFPVFADDFDAQERSALACASAATRAHA